VLGSILGISAVFGLPGSDGRARDVAGIARDYVATVNARDWTHLELLVAPDFTFHNADNGFVQHRDGFVAWTRILGDSFPGFRIAADRVQVDGDVATISFHVVEAGEDAGVVRCDSASPRDARLVRMRVIQHRIVEMWSSYEELGLHC
jgi:hypothetical protein